MSLPSSTKPGGTYRKPRADIYTLFLVIALVAIGIAITFASLLVDIYDGQSKGGSPPAAGSYEIKVTPPEAAPPAT